MESFQCIDRLADKSEVSLIKNALLVRTNDGGDELNKLRKVYFNLDNVTTGALNRQILNRLDNQSDQLTCRQMDSITFSNSFIDFNCMASLLFHMMTGRENGSSMQDLTLKHFSQMDEMLQQLKHLMRESGSRPIRLKKLHFFWCKGLSDVGLQHLAHIFDKSVLTELKLELFDTNISLKNGWSCLLANFSELRVFKCDTFISGAQTKEELIQFMNEHAFLPLTCCSKLQVLHLNFFKFRENLAGLVTINNGRDVYLFGKALFRALSQLDCLTDLSLTDLGDILTQSSVDQVLLSFEDQIPFPKLKRFKLSGTKMTHLDAIFSKIHSTIEALHLQYCGEMKNLISDTEWNHKFERLRVLSLIRMRGLSSDALKFVSQHMTNVKVLTLDECDTLKTFRSLRDLTSLETLHIDRLANFTDRDVRHLKPLVNLKQLDLVSLSLFTGSGFGSLVEEAKDGDYFTCHLPNLRSLTLDWCKCLSDECLTHLQWFSSLEHLSMLHSEKLTQFELLGKLTNLEYLSLNRVPNMVDDALIAIVTNSRQLTHLHINGGHRKLNVNLTNESLRAIGRLRNLKDLELNFCGTQMNDSGIKYLAPLKHSLLSCNFLRCPAMTRAALEKQLPFTSVHKEAHIVNKSSPPRWLLITTFLFSLMLLLQILVVMCY